MERLVDYKYSELIKAGFDILPPGIADKLKYTHFFTGTDPIYAGLKAEDDAQDGRSYRNNWFCSYPWNQGLESKRQRQTTIVLTEYKPSGYPMKLLPTLIVHELAHVIDELLEFGHEAEPITEYARVNRTEAFAEAFVLWSNPSYEEYYDIIQRIDDRTVAFFQGIEEVWRD